MDHTTTTTLSRDYADIDTWHDALDAEIRLLPSTGQARDHASRLALLVAPARPAVNDGPMRRRPPLERYYYAVMPHSDGGLVGGGEILAGAATVADLARASVSVIVSFPRRVEQEESDDR